MRTLLIVCLLFGQQAGKTQPPKDGEFRKAAAAVWEKLATWCVEKKLLAEGRSHAAEALALEPDNAKARAAKGATGDSSASDADQKEYATRLPAAKKALASIYQKWAAAPHPATDDPIFDGYWMKALEYDPRAVAPLYDAEWRQAIQKAQWQRVGPLAAKADEVLGPDPRRTSALHEAEAKASDVTPFLKKASTHEMRYWFSLPKGWTAGRKLPVLFVCDGAGSNFQEQCARFAQHRGDAPVILAALCTFSNTNDIKKEKYPWYSQSLIDEVERTGRIKFDDAGLVAVLEDLERDYGVEEKFFIAGFSGGGCLTWWNIFTRPAEIRGAFPACANFSAAPQKEPEGGRDVPIRAFQGEKDGYFDMLTQQWEEAAALLKKWGYTNYKREVVPNVPHQACHDQVFAAIKEILKKQP